MNKRVMVVDDEKMIEEMFQERLEKWGFDHVSFNNAEKALSYFEENHSKIDLAIIDLTMRGINGIQLAEQMRQLKPGVPIIFMTGKLVKVSDLGSPVDKLLRKPFTKNELFNAILELLPKAA